jgi:hypothetical protein
MQNKKAQATLFIFLGILILVTIILLISIFSRNELTETQEKNILTRTEMQPIKDYVESCLDIISEDALELIGRQGIALYSDQGGTLPAPDPNKENIDYLMFESEPVNFLISLEPENLIADNGTLVISNSKTATEDYHDTTLLVYPWATYPHDPFTGKTTTYLSSGYGWNHLPPLNRVGPNSVEEQLEGYIQTNMLKCVDWDTFDTFDITTTNPQAQVIFAQSRTLVTFKWNVLIQDEDRRGVLDSFVTSIPVRMATIHSFMKSIIDQDVSNITFDIFQNETEFDMFIERGYPKGGSVVRIIDPLSRLREKPYEVRFARANRPPALSRVSQELLNDPVETSLLSGCTGATIQFSGNVLTVQPDPQTNCKVDLSLPITGLDADEENVTFAVTGRTGMPHTITTQDLSSPFPCLPYTVTASDGTDTDWQRINFRLKSTQFAPTCI